MESTSQLLAIELTNPQPVFFAGQTVEGRVVMRAAVHARLAARTGDVDVALRLDAVACAIPRAPAAPTPVFRTLGTQGPLHLRLVSCSSSDEWAAGFRFVLPETAPPTLVTKHGYVAHVLRAEVALAEGVVRALARPLAVLGLADGGAPRFLAGAERSDALPARCGGACGACAALAGVPARVAVARTAWACGEWLAADVALAASPRALRRAVLSLRQRVAFYPSRDAPAHSPLAVSERVLVHRSLAPNGDGDGDQGGDDGDQSDEYNNGFHSNNSKKGNKNKRTSHSSTAQMPNTARDSWRVWLRVPPCCPSTTRSATQLVDVAYALVLSLAPGAGAQLRVPITVVVRPAPSGEPVRDARAAPEALVRAAVAAGATNSSTGGSAIELAHAEDTPVPADLGPFVQYPCFRLPCPAAGTAPDAPPGSERAPLLAAHPVSSACTTTTADADAEVPPEECGSCIFCPPAPLYLPEDMYPSK